MSGAPDTVEIDLELKKAFGELQQKRVESSQKLDFASRQVESIRRSVLHKELTDSEIGSLAPTTRVYQGVGRCFILSSIQTVRENLANSVKELNDKIRVLEQNKDFIVQDLKSTENQLRELVASKKG